MSSKDSLYVKNRPELNSMLSIWYGVLVGSLNIYLIVQSVKRFVWLAELSWPYQKTPFIELNAYIGLTGVAVLLLPFFLAASILKIGNSSNDNQSLGQNLSSEHEKEPYHNQIRDKSSNGFFRTMWIHGGPTASFLHIISSFSLLLPQTIMEAVLAKYGHLPQDTIWRTDLDFMMPQRDRNVILTIISTGDLKNERIESNSGSFMMDHIPGVISMEYLNYALAMIVFSIRYPTVFWKASKTFAFLFSCQLIINTIHSLMSYSCFSVLYKLHVVGPAEVLHKTPKFLLNNHVTLLLYIISSITLFVSSGVFYHYGYLRIVASVNDKAKTQHVPDSNHASRYGPGWTYFPHCSALAALLSLAATQTPVVYDAVLLYKISLDSCMITFVTSSAIHMLFWVLLWLWLTAKTRWNFQVKVSQECIHGKLKSIQYKRSIGGIVHTDSNRTKRVAFFNRSCDNNEETCGVPDSTSRALEFLPQTNLLKQNWQGPCEDIEKQHFLAPEKTEWIKGPNFNPEYTPSRNKVTFLDTISFPGYMCAPPSRPGGLKRSTTDDDINPLNQQDIGNYALLRKEKPIARTSSLRNKPEAVEFQKVPASVLTADSGYSEAADSVSRSDSRSTTGSLSPSFHQASTTILNPPSSSTVANYLFELNCEDQHKRASDYSPYGKIGLMRSESIRSTFHPIYEETARKSLQNPIYESRKAQHILSQEHFYDAPHVINKSIQNENDYSVNVNDLKNQFMDSKPSVESSLVDNTTYPDYYGVNAARKLQELEKSLLKTSDHNLHRDAIKIPNRSNSFRHVRICEPGTIDTPVQPTTCSPCNIIKFDPSTEQRTPPIPAPLPPLSFLSCYRNSHLTEFIQPMSSDFGTNCPCNVIVS